MQSWTEIKKIENPTEEQQLEAVKLNWYAISLIENPTAAVQKAKDVFDRSAGTGADKAALLDAYNDAFKAYAGARLAYFRNKGYDYTADEAQVVADYIALKIAEGGWSKNSLLYAVREGIVNSAPGELPGYDTPNVKANKITFSTGGIGEDSAPVTISREDWTQAASSSTAQGNRCILPPRLR